MSRRSRRDRRTARFWAEKYAAAGGDPARVAAVKWDHARAAIEERGAVDQAALYTELGGLLDGFRENLPAVTQREVHSSQFTPRLPWKR